MNNKEYPTQQAEEFLEPLNEQVIKLLVDNHKQFQSFIERRVGSKAVAEDLLQLSLKKALEHAPRLLKNESILSWFYTILRNTITDFYRSESVEERKREEFKKLLTVSDYSEKLEENVCQCLRELIPTLKPEYGELILKIDLEKNCPDEFSKRLGISRGNLDVRLHRARQALKTSLVRTCGTCTEHGCLNCTCGK